MICTKMGSERQKGTHQKSCVLFDPCINLLLCLILNQVGKKSFKQYSAKVTK